MRKIFVAVEKPLLQNLRELTIPSRIFKHHRHKKNTKVAPGTYGAIGEKA